MKRLNFLVDAAVAARFDAAAAAEGGRSRVLRRLVEGYAGSQVAEPGVEAGGRSTKITVRLRAEEASVLTDVAAEAGFTRTAWVVGLVRSRLLNRPVLNPADAEAYRLAHRELNRIGVNLNQIARAMNTAVLEGAVLKAEQRLIEAARVEIRQEIAELRKALRGNLRYWGPDQ